MSQGEEEEEDEGLGLPARTPWPWPARPGMAAVVAFRRRSQLAVTHGRPMASAAQQGRRVWRRGMGL